MRLDISDLFDHLYDVANFARGRFNLSQSTDPHALCREWDAFCEALSDKLFLPACARRAFGFTGIRIASTDVKPRIITELSPETGVKILYCRYRRPEFYESPRFVACCHDEESQYESTFTRPRHKLTLWLGKLPPSEKDVTPPPYPIDLDAPIRYLARQGFGFFRSPYTFYYEFHGDWCLRRVDQYGASLTRSTLGGQWLRMDGLVDIPQHVFEKVWAVAADQTTI